MTIEFTAVLVITGLLAGTATIAIREFAALLFRHTWKAK